MKYRLIAPIHNLVLESPLTGVFIEDFFISKTETFVLEILNSPRVAIELGTYTTNSFLDNYTATKEFYPPVLDLADAQAILTTQNRKLQSELSSLWYVKDNSVFSKNMFLIDFAGGGVCGDHRDKMYSNSQGLYVDTKFSIEEVTIAASITDKIHKLLPELKVDSEQIVAAMKEVNGNPKFNMSPINFALYNKSTSRLTRALTFVDCARVQSFLPQKISFYICVLECLFTTGNGELTYRVSERTALFTGTCKTSRLDIFENVKKAYDIRSKYFHGDVLKDSIAAYKNLSAVASSLDVIVREIITKMVNKDLKLFVDPNSNLIDEYFKDLIFAD